MASVRKYSNANGLARAAAYLFLDLCSGATQERGRFSVALSGGSTPAALFRLLATENYASSIDWSGVHVFWGDERNVAPEHINSNYRMANDTLLQLVPIPGQNINRILGEIQAGAGSLVELRSGLGVLRYDFWIGLCQRASILMRAGPR